MCASSVWERVTNSVDETIAAGRELAVLLQPNDVALLVGDLGAGKTHLTKGIAQGLGARGKVTSPTFNIVLVYDDGRLPLYHFDLYRLDDAYQLDDIDYFGLLEDGGASIVEWGDKFPEALPETYLEVRMQVDYGAATDAEPARRIQIRGFGVRGEELAAACAAVLPEAWTRVGED